MECSCKRKIGVMVECYCKRKIGAMVECYCKRKIGVLVECYCKRKIGVLVDFYCKRKIGVLVECYCQGNCGIMVEWYYQDTWISWRKTCPSTPFSSTIPTWTDLGSIPGLRLLPRFAVQALITCHFDTRSKPHRL